MKFTVETKKLQDLIVKSMKGASNNKMIPITSLMAIEVFDGVLTLKTTDATNYLYVKCDVGVSNEFSVVVQAELFSKLISKITTKDVTLEIIDSVLYVKGNGTYKIELPLDEEGNLISYPTNKADLDSDEMLSYSIKLEDVIKTIKTAKSALATSLNAPCYMGYYADKDRVIATDTYKICSVKAQLSGEDAILISPELMELISLCTNSIIKVHITPTGDIAIYDEDIEIHGKLMDNVSDYAIEAISDLFSEEFESVCEVNKDALLQVLDRMLLFVSIYDKGEISLTFSDSNLTINSKQVNSVESIDYVSKENAKPFSCVIDISAFQSQVKSSLGANIKIGYGRDNALRIVDEDIIRIIALEE